jgi:hypothetical protein
MKPTLICGLISWNEPTNWVITPELQSRPAEFSWSRLNIMTTKNEVPNQVVSRKRVTTSSQRPESSLQEITPGLAAGRRRRITEVN